MSIKLYDGSGLSQEFSDSEKNLKKDGVSIVKAVVSSGTWIFYTYANYNNAQNGAGPSNYKVVKPGPEVKISSVNGSMPLLLDQVEGVVLFEHSFYGGTNKWFKESCPDLNSFFSTGKVGGVSSTIVLSKNEKFAAVTKTNYQELQQQLEPGKWYASPGDMNFPNDRMQTSARCEMTNLTWLFACISYQLLSFFSCALFDGADFPPKGKISGN
ncbi:uncharacterized protein [Pocillopora verrucosa]|uniref:uncharacterized protein n=1 Tax=Pocillopora verrucosa TaxID=203993 RepID=UPI00333E9C30